MFKTFLTKLHGTTNKVLVISEEGKPLSWFEAKQKFLPIGTQILNWPGLVNCIPKVWKNKFAAESGHSYSAHGNLTTKKSLIITSNGVLQKIPDS